MAATAEDWGIAARSHIRRIAPRLHYFMDDGHIEGHCGSSANTTEQRIRVSYSVRDWSFQSNNNDCSQSGVTGASHPPPPGVRTERVYFRRSLEEVTHNDSTAMSATDDASDNNNSSITANVLLHPLLYISASQRPPVSDHDNDGQLGNEEQSGAGTEVQQWFHISDLIEHIGSFLQTVDVVLRWSLVSRTAWNACRVHSVQTCQDVDRLRHGTGALACEGRWRGVPRLGLCVRALLRHPLVSPPFDVLERARLSVALFSVEIPDDADDDDVLGVPDEVDCVCNLQHRNRAVMHRSLDLLFCCPSWGPDASSTVTKMRLYDADRLQLIQNARLIAFLSYRRHRYDGAADMAIGPPIICVSAKQCKTFLTEWTAVSSSLVRPTRSTCGRSASDATFTMHVWWHPYAAGEPAEECWGALHNLHDEGGALPLHYRVAVLRGGEERTMRKQWSEVACSVGRCSDASTSPARQSFAAM